MPGQDTCQTVRELLATMHTLRSPGGCPWDAEQTAESLTPFILEEACETIEAIEAGSPARVADELGDLLLQIVFQAEIYSERQLFDFADVAAGINAKLIRRHPHVFGEGGAALTADQLDRQWERIKEAEQNAMAPVTPHALGQVPVHLPALQRAQKLLAKASRAGIPLEQELRLPLATPVENEDDFGRALLSLVWAAERQGIDAEQALRRTLHRLFGTSATRHARQQDHP